MYELIFTVIVLVDGKFNFSQTMLHSFGKEDYCIMTKQYVEKELQRTAKQSGTIPGILECRKVI